MRIPNRDRKCGKMSDPVKRAAGLLLVAVALILCFSSFFGGRTPVRSIRYTARTEEPVLPAYSLPDGMIAVNTADEEELLALPGVGETLAAEIVREREKNGIFYFPEDLMAVRGIGRKKLKQMWDMLDLSVSGQEE